MLAKSLASALRSLAGGPTWTITMTEGFYAAALQLEKQGLVEFKPRIKQRGKFAGEPNGYDVVVTKKGLKTLKEIET